MKYPIEYNDYNKEIKVAGGILQSEYWCSGYYRYGKQYYNNGKIEFEGLFYNDGASGKLYDDEGILLYEGQLLIGKKKNGKGREYYENGKLKFEGEYLNDKKIKGKMYDINGDEYLKINNEIDNLKKNDDDKLEYGGKYDEVLKEEGKDNINVENLNLKGKIIEGKKVEKNINYNDNKDKILKERSLGKEKKNYYLNFENKYMSAKKNKVKKSNYKAIYSKKDFNNHKLNNEGGLLRQILKNKKRK